jgi:hypothetical protein
VTLFDGHAPVPLRALQVGVSCTAWAVDTPHALTVIIIEIWANHDARRVHPVGHLFSGPYAQHPIYVRRQGRRPRGGGWAVAPLQE